MIRQQSRKDACLCMIQNVQYTSYSEKIKDSELDYFQYASWKNTETFQTIQLDCRTCSEISLQHLRNISILTDEAENCWMDAGTN